MRSPGDTYMFPWHGHFSWIFDQWKGVRWKGFLHGMCQYSRPARNHSACLFIQIRSSCWHTTHRYSILLYFNWIGRNKILSYNYSQLELWEFIIRRRQLVYWTKSIEFSLLWKAFLNNSSHIDIQSRLFLKDKIQINIKNKFN